MSTHNASFKKPPKNFQSSTLTLSVVGGEFDDKAKCRKKNRYQTQPIELDLNGNMDELKRFFTSKIHSCWLYKNGKRDGAHTTALSAVPFDFDKTGMTFEECAELFRGYAGVVYTSSSDSKKQSKLRVILTLEKPITDRATFQPICNWLKREYPDADSEVFKISQPLFPCCKYDGDKPTTGYPRFRLQVLTGKVFTFPKDLKPKTEKAKKVGKDTGDWELPPDDKPDYSERDKRELDAVLAYYKDHLIKEGTRNKELVPLCAKYRQCGYGKDETFDALCAFNRDFVKPPYPETGIDKSLEQVVNHVFGDDVKAYGEDSWPTLRMALEPTKGEPDEKPRIQNKLQQILVHVPVVAEYGGILVYDVADLIKEPDLIAPPETALLGCAVIGSLNILAGDSGSGKSTFIRSAVIQEVQNDSSKRVLWLSSENEPRFSWWFKRMYPYIKNYQILWVDTRFIKHPPETSKDRWNALYDTIAGSQCDFVIYDSLLNWLDWLDGAAPKNEDTTLWMYKTNLFGDLVLRTGGTPLIIHHTNKSGEYALSAGIKNASHNMFLYERVGGSNENLRQLKVLKTRDGVQPYKVECFPEDNFKYEIRILGGDVEPQSVKPKYTPAEVQILSLLLAGVRDRPAIQKHTGLAKGTLTKRRDKLSIPYAGTPEQWEPTDEQIKQWRADGVEPARASVQDVMNNNLKSEDSNAE